METLHLISSAYPRVANKPVIPLSNCFSGFCYQQSDTIPNRYNFSVMPLPNRSSSQNNVFNTKQSISFPNTKCFSLGLNLSRQPWSAFHSASRVSRSPPFCPSCIWIHEAQPVCKAMLPPNISTYVCSRDHGGTSNGSLLSLPEGTFSLYDLSARASQNFSALNSQTSKGS